MHDITPPLTAGMQLIQSYGPGGFRIGNVMHDGPVLVLPTATVAWSGALTLEALAPLLEVSPPTEVLLIGTGARHDMLDAGLRQALKTQGFPHDTMDSGAACRTFNILLGEGRRVAAALRLPV